MISDALNHASIIDGIRLCKAQRLRYANNDLDELETRLKEAADARVRLIATDGVFSMDGVIAHLKDICDLAERYGALVMVDDSHATGFVGRGGRGTPEHRGVLGRIDILTSTLGKALGGAAGGFTAARRPIVEWLRQRSRPYLFSNSIPPVIAATTLRVLDLVQDGEELRARLTENTQYFRRRMTDAGFDVVPGEHRDHARDAGRRAARGTVRRPSARSWRVCDRLFLSRRADGQGAHPHADVRGTRSRSARPGDRRIHRHRPRARCHWLSEESNR